MDANPVTSDPSPLPPTYGPRPVVESNGYLNGRFIAHVSGPMDKIVADPAISHWWLDCLVKMLVENPDLPPSASPSTNATGKNMILQLNGEACHKGLLALEKVKNEKNWGTVKSLFGFLDEHLWEKQAQSANWREAYPGLYDSRCGATYIRPFYDDANLIMVSHYAGVLVPR